MAWVLCGRRSYREFAGSSNIPGQSLALVFVTAGPRFTYHTHRFHRYAPFAQGLVPSRTASAPFPNHSGSTTEAASALAALVGGGLDISITDYRPVRPIQVDYGYWQLPSSITPIRMSSATPRASSPHPVSGNRSKSEGHPPGCCRPPQRHSAMKVRPPAPSSGTPTKVAVDGRGNIYIRGLSAGAIRKVDALTGKPIARTEGHDVEV